MGSKRDLEREFERLKDITQSEQDILKNVYADFFGNKTKNVLPKVGEQKHPEQELTAEEKAQSALKEAKEIFGDSTMKEAEAEEPLAEAEPEIDPMEQLDELIGLGSIKHDVKELIDFVKVQKLRSDEGLKSVPVSLHLVFTGNPGTGKTTVARILSKLYHKIGVLSKGTLVEVDRSGLVAGYVGQTAIKTQEMIKKAQGGILFIDEAYALAKKDDAFGQEAIDTILKAMEDQREDFVVIVAGYSEPMEAFINSNPGLKSRFNKYIEFQDYTEDELEQIFYVNVKKYDYTVSEEAKLRIKRLIAERRAEKCENFANAREVRNLFEEIITNQSRRVAGLPSPAREDLMQITVDDLSEDSPIVQPEPDAAAVDAAADDPIEA